MNSHSEHLQELADELTANRVGTAIAAAIAASYEHDPAGKTDDEIRRRTRVCLDYYVIMRGDLRFSIAKACDALPHVLVAELDADPAELLDEMKDRGWVSLEQRTSAGLVLPG